jgi:hypothetical protein
VGRLVEYQIAVPPDLKVRREAAENLLVSLAHSGDLVGFELIGVHDRICVQLVSRESDRSHLTHQLAAHFPEAVGTHEAGYLQGQWESAGNTDTLIVDFGLSQEFMRPIRVASTLEPDPLVSVFGTLGGLQDNELGVYQVLFQATRHPWSDSVLRSVTDAKGSEFFSNSPDMVKLAKQKISRPMFAVVIRAAAKSPTPGRATEIVRNLAGGLQQFSSPSHNELIPLHNNGYSDRDHGHDLVARATRRSGMLLNSEELASLAHLPSASVRSLKLVREKAKTKAAPAIVTGHRLIIGDNTHAGATIECSLSNEALVRHTLMLGATGTGKTMLILGIGNQHVLAPILEGLPVIVIYIDPHGDLVDDALGRIPERLHEHVLIIDLGDPEYSVGLNVLESNSEQGQTVLSSDLVPTFRRYSTSWGDQMTAVLGNAIQAFLTSDRGGTLVDLRRFLVDASFRRSFLRTVSDPHVVYFWEKEFPLLPGRPQAPLLTRLDAFLRPKSIRHMVGQKTSLLDFEKAMNGKGPRYIFFKLAQGVVGVENAHLMGTFVLSKIYQHGMSRQLLPEAERPYTHVLIDEFQNVITPSLTSGLSSLRKFRVGLTCAGQDLKALRRDPELLNAVITNPYTRVCFRLGDDDAKKLENSFSHFDAQDLQNLGIGEAICRVERSDFDFNLKTRLLPPVDPDLADARREKLREMSRRKYARPTQEVEEAIRLSMTGDQSPESAGSESVTEASRHREGAPGSTPRRTPRPTLGRGGGAHRYTQQLIKRGAERFGFRATIEKPILNGLGSVDVALERGGRRIACEVSATSPPAQELANIRKCLAAGFELIASVSADEARRDAIASEASKELSAEEVERVQFVSPDELLKLIEQLSADAETEASGGTTLGYRVDVVRVPVEDVELRYRSDAVLRLLAAVAQRRRGTLEGDT